MKKIISLIMSIVMLSCVAFSVVPVSSGYSVAVNEGFYLKAVPEESDADTLVYDLCCNDTRNLGIASVGMYIDYSDNLILESSENIAFGMFVGSQSIDMKPYCIMWVGGTQVIPYGETPIIRLVFKVVDTIKNGVSFDVNYDPYNLPGGLYDSFDEDEIPVAGEVEYTYSELLEQFPSISKPSEDTPPEESEPVEINNEGFYLKPMPDLSTKDVLVYDLCVNDVNRCGISCFAVEVDYSEELILDSAESLYNKGILTLGERINVKPYPVLLVLGTSVLEFGEIAIARFTFRVASSLEDGVTLGVEYDENNMPTDINENKLDEKDVPIMGILDFSYEDICKQFPFLNSTPGDVNNDGKVTISDASRLIKYLAKWDVEVNLEAADVNDDGKANISDISLILKYLAKWDVELK